MGQAIYEFFLPTTDAGVFAQWIGAAVVFPLLLWRFWDNRDARFFLGATAFATVAWFGLRAAH